MSFNASRTEYMIICHKAKAEYPNLSLISEVLIMVDSHIHLGMMIDCKLN